MSEAIGRQVRDLEDEARYLFVPHAKTRAGRRRVKTVVLRDLLLAQAERARAAAQAGGVVPLSPPLFPGLSRFSVRRAVRRICRAAGVPVITTHALRATMASLAAAGGEVLGAVAGDLGHASEQVTRQSYATAEAVAAGAQERALARLEGDGPEGAA